MKSQSTTSTHLAAKFSLGHGSGRDGRDNVDKLSRCTPKPVVVFLTSVQEVYIDTGERRYSGTEG